MTVLYYLLVNQAETNTRTSVRVTMPYMPTELATDGCSRKFVRLVESCEAGNFKSCAPYVWKEPVKGLEETHLGGAVLDGARPP